MGWYGDRVLPRITEVAMRGEEVRPFRERVCAGLSGRVVELGFGSGLNLEHLPSAVTSLEAVEPSDVAWQISEPRRRAAAVPVTRAGLDGQRLPFPDGSVDTVLSTFSLCTIPEPVLALAEVRRVLAPGGWLCFAEHGLSPDAGVARWQRRLEPVQRRVAGGCHLTRAIDEVVAVAGLAVRDLRREYAAGPAASRPWGYVYTGHAGPGPLT